MESSSLYYMVGPCCLSIHKQDLDDASGFVDWKCSMSAIENMRIMKPDGPNAFYMQYCEGC